MRYLHHAGIDHQNIFKNIKEEMNEAIVVASLEKRLLELDNFSICIATIRSSFFEWFPLSGRVYWVVGY